MSEPILVLPLPSRRSRLRTLTKIAVCLAAAVGPTVHVAEAAKRPPHAPTPRADPHVATLFAHRARTGKTLPVYVPNAAFEIEGMLPVVVRFRVPPTRARLAALARAGVVWERSGEPLLSGAYAARVSEGAMRALDADGAVLHVESDLPLRAPLPLDASIRATAADYAQRAFRAKDGVELDGAGTVIADLDTSVFVFHPSLFRADAGVFAWRDENGDGALTPGVDGIDLDASGTLDPGEVLRVLPAISYERDGKLIEGESKTFRPERDFLFCDTNGNGRREYGKSFGESTPAYGEPLFVFDDANQDGKLDVSERLLRLGTSKIRAVRGKREFVRGGSGAAALSAYDVGVTAEAYEQMGHATGVAGILVGGTPRVSRWLGLAPGADLLVADYYESSARTGAARSIQWAIDRQANVILTEYAPYNQVPLDGSSEEEMLLDAALDKGIVTVSPAGNLAGGHKHRTVSLSEGVTQIGLKADEAFRGGKLVQLSLLYRGTKRALSLSMVMPNGVTIDIPDSEPVGKELGGGLIAYAIDQTSGRGTLERHVILYNPTAGAFPMGVFRLDVKLDEGPPIEAELYAGDDRTSWANGFTFDRDEPSRTVCHPATSDRTIAVAAYVLHDEIPYAPYGKLGELAGYSSRGPRIDGLAGISLAAPDNPMSLAPPLFGEWRHAGMSPFGGTSGAGPHVAAAAALLRQAFPMESGEALRARLVGSAKRDETTEAGGEMLWGKGRLDIAAALGGGRLMGSAPTLTLHAPAEAGIGREALLSLDVTDDHPVSELRARWDLDNDGVPDTEWEAINEHRITATEVGHRDIRVDVLDADGYIVAATTRVRFVHLADAGADGGLGATPTDPGACGCTAVGGATSPFAAGAGAALLTVLGARRRRAGARSE